MVDLDWKAKMVTPEMSNNAPKLSDKSHRPVPPILPAAGELLPASPSSTSAYEQYLRLPELSKLWSSKDFPNWETETLLKPALQGLEITFRFVSLVLSDTRRYANRREWERRLESLTARQIELLAAICEEGEGDDKTRGAIPIVDHSKSDGVLARGGSLSEVWKAPGSTLVVSRTSEASLLPRLATWQKSEDVASKIALAIECQMQGLPFTLGLGEPNFAGKPNIEYDLVCRPSDLHALKRIPIDLKNQENETLFTTHQILESWIFVGGELVRRIGDRIQKKEYERCASDCWLLERIWKLLADIEDLHLLMDPDDFLRLKNQLAIKSTESDSFCFRSKALLDLTRSSKNLRHMVPEILGVEADPEGGPRVQEAAMKLFRRKTNSGKIHLLQAFQAIEAAVKKFFFSYRELIVILMGSLEAKGNHAISYGEVSDQLSQIFLEPSYFPSLDAAKTFLGNFWQCEQVSRCNGTDSRNGRKN